MAVQGQLCIIPLPLVTVSAFFVISCAQTRFGHFVGRLLSEISGADLVCTYTIHDNNRLTYTTRGRIR